MDGSADYLMPGTYASMVYADVLELHLEGFHNWGSSAEMERFARTVTELMRGVDLEPGQVLASDVGGEVERAGIRSYPDSTTWKRVTLDGFSGSNFSMISAWDASGELLELTESAYRGGRLRPAVATFVHAWLQDPDGAQSRPATP